MFGSFSWFRIALGGGLMLGVAGCDSGPAPLTPVQGKVTWRGAPLATGTIVFAPDASRGALGSLARGDIQADGRYFLRTGSALGASTGWQRVTIVAIQSGVSNASWSAVPQPVSLLPDKYRDPELSGLNREVKEGRTNTIDFDLRE